MCLKKVKIYFLNTDLLSCQRFFPRSWSHPQDCEALEACRAPASALVLVLHPLVALVLGLSRSASPALLPADTTATRPPVRPYQGCTTKTRAKAQPLQKQNQPVQKPKTSAKAQPKSVQKHNHKFCESTDKQPNNHLTFMLQPLRSKNAANLFI